MSFFSRLSLRGKILSVNIVLTVLLTLVLFGLYYLQAKSSAIDTFARNANAVNLMAESTRMEMDDKLEQGVIETSQLRDWAARGENDKILGAVPVVTAWRSAMRKAKEAGYTFKVPKLQPRNPKNLPDEIETRALKKMAAEGVDQYHEIDEENNVIRSFRAVRLTPSCLVCHGDPATSQQLWGNDKGQDPFGFRMENWKAGEVHGAFEIIQSLVPAEQMVRDNLKTGGLVVILGIFISSFLFYLIIAWSVNRPVKNVTNDLEQASNQVAAASSEISTSSQSLADGASNQASSLEETSSSLEELSSMTKLNADNAAKANDLMGETRSIVVRAGKSMEQMSASMTAISFSGQEINKIIKTIDEIAFQTNLLALNAAVEAARAGEAGMGFAVVADEVRNLAGRTAEAAQNTTGLIEDTIKKINQGNQFVDQANQAFDEVNQAAAKVAQLVGDVAAASAEQSQGIDQINKAMSQMDQVIQNNAAQAEESAAASEQLDAQAESLHDIVNNLEEIVNGYKKDGSK